MRKILGLAAALCAAAVAACSGPDATAYQTVDTMYGHIQRNEADAAVAMMEPSQADSMRNGIAQLNGLVPQGAPSSSTNSGWNVSVNAGQPRQTTVSREYTYPDRIVTATAILVDGPGEPRWRVLGYNVNTRPNGSGAPAATTAAAPASGAAPSEPSSAAADLSAASDRQTADSDGAAAADGSSDQSQGGDGK